MSKKMAIVKLVGGDAIKYGTSILDNDFRKVKGIPVEAKEIRRYRDVSSGVESVSIVMEHESFSEVEGGGAIPQLQTASVVKKNEEENKPDKVEKKKK